MRFLLWVNVGGSALKKKKKGVSYAKWGYIFALPFCIAYLIFMIYPICYTFTIGFTDLTDKLQMKMALDSSVKMQLLDDVFANYKFVLTDPNFWKSLRNTLIIWGMNFAPQIILALVLAVWFTNSRMKIRGKGAFKVLFYMPNIITAATIAMLFTQLFDYNMGPVNALLKNLGVIGENSNINFFENKWAARGIIAFVQFWMWYGYTMIILISGILGISPELFEAADIDGASGWQKFIYVTLPNLKTIMLYTLVTSMIGGMQMFDIPFMIAGQGGLRSEFRTVSVYIFEMSFQGGKLYNRASAASMLMFVMIAILAAIIFFMLRDKDEIAQHRIEKAQTKAFKKQLKEQKAKGGVQ